MPVTTPEAVPNSEVESQPEINKTSDAFRKLDNESIIDPEKKSTNDHSSMSQAEKDLRPAFDLFDLNGDGFITKEELTTYFAESLGETCASAFAELIISKVGTHDKDGRISWNDFKKGILTEEERQLCCSDFKMEKLPEEETQCNKTFKYGTVFEKNIYKNFCAIIDEGPSLIGPSIIQIKKEQLSKIFFFENVTNF